MTGDSAATPPAFQHELDATGVRCPEPVMMLHGAIRRMPAGDVLRVSATDPTTARDIPQFCKHLGHALLLEQRDGERFIYFIRKKSAA